MQEILPYLNVFPASDIADDAGLYWNLTQEEGISELTPAPEETQPQVVYETDEYVEPAPAGEEGGEDAQNNQLPGAPPGNETAPAEQEAESG